MVLPIRDDHVIDLEELSDISLECRSCLLGLHVVALGVSKAEQVYQPYGNSSFA